MNANHPQHRKSTIAILSRGDAEARRQATASNSRFVRVFEALSNEGLEALPVIYDEEFADDVRKQLLAVDGVLVWVDPIHQGKNRAELDGLLRDVATRGPWVSAHPDVILKMGVKEVLYRTRHLGWGTDTRLYDSWRRIRAEFPAALEKAGPRVLKQNRGNGGQGVWKVEGGHPAGAAQRCGCSTPNAGACLKRCRWPPSWRDANLISAGAAASSTSHFSSACRRA